MMNNHDIKFGNDGFFDKFETDNYEEINNQEDKEINDAINDQIKQMMKEKDQDPMEDDDDMLPFINNNYYDYYDSYYDDSPPMVNIVTYEPIAGWD